MSNSSISLKIQKIFVLTVKTKSDLTRSINFGRRQMQHTALFNILGLDRHITRNGFHSVQYYEIFIGFLHDNRLATT